MYSENPYLEIDPGVFIESSARLSRQRFISCNTHSHLKQRKSSYFCDEVRENKYEAVMYSYLIDKNLSVLMRAMQSHRLPRAGDIS